MCVRQMRPPGRGDFWILKIAHAPSDKNLSKNGSAHKGGSLCVKDVFAKKILVPGEIPLAALAPAYRAAAKARVDVILAGGDAAVRAARQATTGYRNGFTNSRRGSRQMWKWASFRGRANSTNQAETVWRPLSSLCTRGINTASMIATRISAGTSPTR